MSQMISLDSNDEDWRDWTRNFESKVSALGLWGVVFDGEKDLECPQFPNLDAFIHNLRQKTADEAKGGAGESPPSPADEAEAFIQSILQKGLAAARPPPKSADQGPRTAADYIRQQFRTHHETHKEVIGITKEERDMYKLNRTMYEADRDAYRDQRKRLKELEELVQRTVSPRLWRDCCPTFDGVWVWYKMLKETVGPLEGRIKPGR